MSSSTPTTAPSADAGPVQPAETPFVLRLAAGDITRAQASLIVVNHFSGVDPGGAEAAVDRAMNGAIGRRADASALNGRFGTSYFLPAGSSLLAADAVLVLGLGAPEQFNEARVPELGMAIVEAMATFALRDAATILHGAGNIGLDAERAAALLVSGVLTGLQAIPGAGCFRELAIYELDEARLPAIQRGAEAALATSTPGLRVYLEGVDTAARRPVQPAPALPAPERPDQLRIYITRNGPDVKVGFLGEEAYDLASGRQYPDKIAKDLSGRIKADVIDEPDLGKRGEALRSIGEQLYNSFLGWTQFGLAERIEAGRDGYVVLRLDDETVDLPWELLCLDGEYLTRTHVFARQLEINSQGRQAAVTVPHERLQVLVIGDPTSDLDGARREAEAVAQKLEQHAGADVTALIGDVTYAAVSRELDTTSFDVVHYAGHARFDPMRESASGFALADSTLTADDLATRRYLPRLFLANACNSAQTGDSLPPDPFAGALETLNVVTGLLSAGVQAFVGSAWKVDDEAATTFASAFYDALLADGRGATPIGEAVRCGRRAIVDEHGEGEPAWAGYALYGNPWKPAF